MNYNKFIDHTLLKPTATSADIIKLCKEAREHNFYSVCVNPYFVKLAKSELKGTNVKVACVIGFPLGANLTEIKRQEAFCAVRDGADELDMVMNQGLFKMAHYREVIEDINAVCESGAVIKVIVETSNLNEEEIDVATHLINQSNAHFIKTSTGFIGDGAKVSDKKIMKKRIVEGKQIKASGGIRDKETFLKMIQTGATRIGTSSGVKLVN